MLSFTVGVEAQPALVGAEGVIELHPPGPVRPDFAGVGLPGDTEADDAIGLGDPLEDLGAAVVLVGEIPGQDRGHDFADGLLELRLMRIAALQPPHEGLVFPGFGFGHGESGYDLGSAAATTQPRQHEQSEERRADQDHPEEPQRIGTEKIEQICLGGFRRADKPVIPSRDRIEHRQDSHIAEGQ